MRCGAREGELVVGAAERGGVRMRGEGEAAGRKMKKGRHNWAGRKEEELVLVTSPVVERQNAGDGRLMQQQRRAQTSVELPTAANEVSMPSDPPQLRL